MVPCKATTEEFSFEWSHQKIMSTDSKVRTTLHVSIIDSGSERVKHSKVRTTLHVSIIDSGSEIVKHSKECFIMYPNTLNSIKKLGCSSFFQPTSRCLEFLMKHASSCLIYYFT